MMQMRMSDGRAYNPSRDIVQLFPRVIGYHAVVRLAAHNWPPMIRKYAADNGLSTVDLMKAEKAFAEFILLSTHSNLTDFNDIFVRSGLAALPGPILLTLMAVIGEVTCGVFFKTVRAATAAGRTVPGAQELGEVAERAAFALSADRPSVSARRQAEAETAALPSILNNDPTSTP